PPESKGTGPNERPARASYEGRADDYCILSPAVGHALPFGGKFTMSVDAPPLPAGGTMRIWLVVPAGGSGTASVAGTSEAGAAGEVPAADDAGAVQSCVPLASWTLLSSGLAAATGAPVAIGADASGADAEAGGVPPRFMRLLAIRVRAGGVV